MTAAAVLAVAIQVAMVLLLLGLAFALVRMLLGPSLPDRIVALDMVSMLLVGFAAAAAIAFDEPAFLDVAITLALVAFLGTVAFARYVERLRAQQAAEPNPGDGAAPTGQDGR
jgi:multicomponent Na+:H+ antiporter subunit F